jgi:transketolase
MDNWHQSQRGYFAGALYEEMLKDDRIYLVTADLGYGAFDKIKEAFPNRFINVGASEQAGMGIAVGLAKSGMKPFFYTISSFYLRCAETVSLYVKQEKAPVIMVGAGRDDDYRHDGVSHNGLEAQKFMSQMDIALAYPKDKEKVPKIVKFAIEHGQPLFISLRR